MEAVANTKSAGGIRMLVVAIRVPLLRTEEEKQIAKRQFFQ